VLYNLLTGHPPFEGTSTVDILHKHLYGQFVRPQKLVTEIPHDLDEVICQLLEKDPARRPPDGLVLHRQLDSIRRKQERKAYLTRVSGPEERTVAENQPETEEAREAGPATLMSQFVREELTRQKEGGTLGQWLNRVWVVLPLFLICVGLIIWSFWLRPTPSAEELFEKGSALMASSRPGDWDKAWSDYLEPLNRNYLNHSYRKEVEAYRQKIDDQAGLARALAGARAAGAISEAQRFYLRGRGLCQEGDVRSARRVWKNLVIAFGEVETEKRWVDLALAGLAQLHEPNDEDEPSTVDQAIARVHRLRAQGKPEAAEIERSLLRLYPDDPSIRGRLQQ
jgi:serine/threonine-protein kinase